MNVIEDTECLPITKPYDISRMNDIKENINLFLESSDPYFDITGLNAYLRRYLYSELNKKYPNIFAESVKTEGSRDVIMRLHRVDPENALRMKNEKETKKMGEFNEKIGFRRIFNMLIQA